MKRVCEGPVASGFNSMCVLTFSHTVTFKHDFFFNRAFSLLLILHQVEHHDASCL